MDKFDLDLSLVESPGGRSAVPRVLFPSPKRWVETFNLDFSLVGRLGEHSVAVSICASPVSVAKQIDRGVLVPTSPRVLQRSLGRW